MGIPYDRSLSANSRVLRKAMTEEECHLWYDFLKKLPIPVNRQKVIGRFIVDFYIASRSTVIELDGAQHGEPAHHEKDLDRDAELRSLGIRVLRYTNRDIQCKFQDVCTDIRKHLGL